MLKVSPKRFFEKIESDILKLAYIFSYLTIPFVISFFCYFLLTSLVLNSHKEDYKKKRFELIHAFNSVEKINCSQIPSNYKGDFQNVDAQILYDDLVGRFREGNLGYYWLGFYNHLSPAPMGDVGSIDNDFFSFLIKPFHEVNLKFNNSFNEYYLKVHRSGRSIDFYEGQVNGRQIDGMKVRSFISQTCEKYDEKLGFRWFENWVDYAKVNGGIDVFMNDHETEYVLAGFKVYTDGLLKNIDQVEAAYAKAKADRIWFYVVSIFFLFLLYLNGLIFLELRKRRIPRWGQFITEWGTDKFGKNDLQEPKA